MMKGIDMSTLSKFTFKTLAKAPPPIDPIQRRRDKIVAAIEQQKLVLAAALKGETFALPAKTDKAAKAVRPWWIAQDNGYYVQCRYGARPLLLNATNNAVYVTKLDEVSAVLAAFAAAAKSGELDKAMAAVAVRTKG